MACVEDRPAVSAEAPLNRHLDPVTTNRRDDLLWTGEPDAPKLRRVRKRLHHRVYVVRLANPRGDGRDGYYVGMTGLPLEERFANHKRGYKGSRVVREHGVALAWELFEGIPAMSFAEAALTEPTLADDLRDLGYLVYGPTNRKARPRARGARRSR